MPKFIDVHTNMPSMPPEMLQKLRSEMGKTDSNGVKGVDVILTKDGQGYCVSEAPNADAVCKAHESKGMKLAKGDVHEISSMMR